MLGAHILTGGGQKALRLQADATGCSRAKPYAAGGRAGGGGDWRRRQLRRREIEVGTARDTT
jgi:hypothetical protein